MARQNFVGLVISQGKMNKTVKVRVQSTGYDKRVHKEVLKRKDYLVHDSGNLCKEGDIVRIESIPKMTERKYFAIAEIKVNKGQQFAQYQELAKKQVAKEEKAKIEEFLNRRNELSNVIKKVEDLKQLDQISKSFQKATEEQRPDLLKQITDIKERYNIKSWPSTEEVLPLAVNEAAKDLSIVDNRLANIRVILDKLMSQDYKSQRLEILAQIGRGSEEELKPNVMKNMLRKWVMNPRNDVPVSL